MRCSRHRAKTIPRRDVADGRTMAARKPAARQRCPDAALPRDCAQARDQAYSAGDRQARELALRQRARRRRSAWPSGSSTRACSTPASGYRRGSAITCRPESRHALRPSAGAAREQERQPTARLRRPGTRRQRASKVAAARRRLSEQKRPRRPRRELPSAVSRSIGLTRDQHYARSASGRPEAYGGEEALHDKAAL